MLRFVRITRSDDQLLDKFYDQLLVPNFEGVPDELDDRETFRSALDGCYPYTPHIIVVVDEHDTVMAGVAYEYYPKSRCTLATYLAVKSEARRSGLATALISAINADLDLHHPESLALFAEYHSDRFPESRDTMSPRLRRRILTQIGFHHLDMNYVQPPTSEGKGKCRDLLLAVYKRDASADSISCKIVLDWLTEYYEVLLGENYSEDRDLQTALSSYSATEFFRF